MDISKKTRTMIDLTSQTFEEVELDADNRSVSFVDKADGEELVIYLSEGQFVSLENVFSQHSRNAWEN